MARWALPLRAIAAAVLVLAFLLSATTPSLAVGGQTGNLTGTIIDGGSKNGIANVQITAASPSARYTARTDSRGFFAINGMTVDTYTVTATASGFETLVISGVTIAGDQTVSLDVQPLQKRLQEIGRLRARSQSNVFQPAQTIDAVTISGARSVQATGKAASTDAIALARSAPGVQLTNTGMLTIRGGLRNEVGYQFDGVTLQEPYLNRDAQGSFAGLGSLQVVAGAGDPSQGNVGSGILNFTVKRGARPAFGYLDFEASAPFFNHQFGFEYGWATPNGRFSNYTTYIGNRYNPASYPAYGDAVSYGLFNGTNYVKADDFINNFIYRFGKDNSQSLQVLYREKRQDQYGYIVSPDGRQAPFQRGSFTANNTAANIPGDFADPQGFLLSSVFPVFPYNPGSNASAGGELNGFFPLHFLKFEYNNALNSSTFLALRAYNWEQENGGSSYYTNSVAPTWSRTGGARAGVSGEITKTLNAQHNLQIGGKLENAHPLRDEFRLDTVTSVLPQVTTPGNGVPTFYDFATPSDLTAASPNQCAVNAASCYLYKQLGGARVQIPLFGVDYFGADYQTISGFIRDTWTPSRRITVDAGVRLDAVNFKQGNEPQWGTTPDNPTDVDPTFVGKKYVSPRIAQPRFSAVYQFSNVDSLRFGYGLSVIFANAQTFGTPASLKGLDSRLFNIAPLPGTNTSDPKTWTCGSGYNSSRLLPGGANASGLGGGFFRCANYAQQLFWYQDQTLDAPDVGNNAPPTYGNYDLTYQHQFKNGMGLRLTGYSKRGYNLPVTFLINQFTDPVTGAITAQVFAVANSGINRANGVEFGLSLPDRPYGFTGYLSATYTNVFNSTPPLISGEDQLPLVSKASLALGNIYRAGFVSPFTVNAGLSYKTRQGWRIAPVWNYDRGYPAGAGNLTPSGARFAQGAVILGQYQTIVQSNLDNVTYPSYQANWGNAYTPSYRGAYTATNYVDPVNPGNYFRPNIAATRGTAEAASAGGILSRPRLYTNLTLEYQMQRNTFGLLINNLFNNIYSEPTLNPLWQPVATGIGGPLTGQRSQAFPGSSTYNFGTRNIPADAYGRSPYVETPNNPITYRLYYQLAL